MPNADELNGGSRPIPDPTVLTTALIDRASLSIREYIDGKVETIEQRLHGIDVATELRLGGIVNIPRQIDEKVSHLEQLTTVRFESIANQFKERDTRSERESRDNKVAVDAAFAAQKEAASEQNKSNTLAIDKSEKATTETLNKLSELFKTTTDGLGANINDLKSRMDRMEGTLLGALAQRTELRQSNAAVYAAIGIALSVIVAAIAIIGLVAANSPN